MSVAHFVSREYFPSKSVTVPTFEFLNLILTKGIGSLLSLTILPFILVDCASQ